MERSISSLTKRSPRMRKVKRSATGMLVTCASDETIRHRGPFFVPLGSLFSTHLETSSLAVKGCKLRLMLGIHGH